MALAASVAQANEAKPVAPAFVPDAARGSALFTAACVACHGADGNASTPNYPKLAGQHPEYLVKQLTEFKSGKRANPIMAGFAGALSSQDMQDIALWLSQQKPKPGFAKHKETLALGEQLYRGGLVDRQIAACAGCHSPNGAGIPAKYPRLAGQNADYTLAQLVAFREGRRSNGPAMAEIAAKMSDKEMAAVADYIAGLR